VVLSQRLDTTFEGDAFSLYRALRIVNPSPYMFYLHFGDTKLVGASPEIHVRSYGGDVTIRPIAGTRARGLTVEEDMRLEKELLADEKERAEHLMLVDLARNDIGRVCRYGSVRATEFMVVERYSHVMHIVSDVEGALEENRDAFDLIAATFPAGTVSGAPKIRAMEIIEELEPNRRGPYAGLVGYFSFNGNFDSCITIRTMLVSGNRVYVQAGAGIVADSIPEREYEETLNKAQALFRAIQMARGGTL
jgi:anthranilate synthase component 1